MGYANARGLFPRLRRNRSNSRATTNVSANVRQRYAAACQSIPIAARAMMEMLRNQYLRRISVTPTLSTVRARTFGLGGQKRSGGCNLCKMPCALAQSVRKREPRRMSLLNPSRGPQLTAHLLARHTYVTCRVSVRSADSRSLAPHSLARAGPGSLLTAQVPSPADPSRTRRPMLRPIARAFAGRWRVPGSKESCRIFQ
jgi:hypothetical protein